MYKNPASGSVKFLIGFCIVTVLRLSPLRPWNAEPILSVVMPFARFYGPVTSFFFAFLSMAAYDAIVGKIGIWTAVTSLTYGAVAALASPWLRRRNKPVFGYVSYAVVGTLLFDVVTMASGPMFHFVLSPLVGRCVVREKRLEADALFADWAVKAEQ